LNAARADSGIALVVALLRFGGIAVITAGIPPILFIVSLPRFIIRGWPADDAHPVVRGWPSASIRALSRRLEWKNNLCFFGW
jgi:hypothetical protein